MALRFTVLASGSAGNASILEANGFGVLLDAGLGPRLLTERLAAVGLSWQNVQVVLLTHTHSDHWKETSLIHLLRRRIPFRCHADHGGALQEYSAAFLALRAGGLVEHYDSLQPFELAPGLSCRPFPLLHDSGATFGFRFEFAADHAAVAYAADLGTWTPDLCEHLADVDILGLEFNHDVELEKSSGRARHLIARVLGDRGHLSNAQAAALLREVLARSASGRLQHLVQLHLSRDCNRAKLAVAAAQAVAADAGECLTVHTARQDVPGPSLLLSELHERKRRREASPPRPMTLAQPFLPGWEAG